MLGTLNPCGGGDPIPLMTSNVVIGRRSRCDIVLDLPNVSSKHCELEYVDGHWRIRDLASRNGIKVNGERHDLKWLFPGDQISIAKNHFIIQYEPVGSSPKDDENPFELSLMEKAGLQKRRAEERATTLPPAAKKPTNTKFNADEDTAVDFLLDD